MSREPRALELSPELREQLITLRRISSTSREPALLLSQVVSLEEALDCEFPDSVLALFANGDDGLFEQCGVQIEEVFDNTSRAHELGHPRDKIAIGRHPDSHCFYCVSKRPPSAVNPGITEFDNFDGSSRFYSLSEWLDEIIEMEVEIREGRPEVGDEDPNQFQPRLVE